MAYLNNAQKFACVLNANTPIPRLMNALAHVTAGLAANLGRDTVQYLEYGNESEGFTAKIALSPFIILKAKNSNQLATLRAAASAEGIAHNVFVSAMIGPSAEEQLAQTRAAAGAALEHWAVVLFGDAEKIQPLTKKFSVFSISAPESGG
jgi:Protein of unknown function (DUF2000)